MNFKTTIASTNITPLEISRANTVAYPKIQKPAIKREPEPESDRSWIIISYLLLLAFSVIQITLILMQKTGPFYDEAIYMTAGLRTLQGKGMDDGYMVWFAGSLLWPTIAGLGSLIYGLIAVRLIAFLLALIGLLATYLAAKNLFGARAACFTLLTFILNAPLMALAHLGVYDLPALAFTGISFWGITQLQKRDHRFWLCLSSVSLAMAAISKYPIGLMIIPIFGLILIGRGQKRVTDMALFMGIFAGVFLAFFLPTQYQVGDWLSWSSRNKPTFNETKTTIIATLLYSGLIPMVLALLGLVITPKKKLAFVLFLSGLIWPAYHIISGNPVSDNKHVVFGFVFIYPLIGLFCSSLWRKKWIGKTAFLLLCLALMFIGVKELDTLDAAWPDTRPATTFLTTHAHSGDIFLINDAWPYTLDLYQHQKITEPWKVFDNYRINNHENPTSICRYDWFVDEQGSYAWPTDFKQRIESCHTFKPVYHAQSYAVGIGNSLTYIRYTVTTTIYINTHANPASTPLKH